MKKYTLIFLFVLNLIAQEVVTVLSFESSSKLILFELDFLKQVIKLYNTKHAYKLSLKVISVRDYSDIFKKIGSSKETDLICAIRAITITEERKKKYDFSSPYLPIKQVLITNKDKLSSIKNWRDSRYTIYGNKNTIHYKNAKLLSNKYGFKFYKPKSNKRIVVNNYLKKGEIDFYVGDMTDVIVTERVILADFEEALLSEYGILYPKDSKLKRKLDKFVKYSVKSPTYYKLLVKHFGNEIAVYLKTLSEEKKARQKK